MMWIESGNDFYLRLAPRSGLALNYGIDVMAGVCDADYVGEILPILINHGKENFIIQQGDKIVQLIPEKILQIDLKATSSEPPLTDRESGAFGHSAGKMKPISL